MPTKGPELLNGRRTVDIGTHHQGTAALIFEMQAKLCGGRCLTGTLQAGHEHNRRSFGGLGQGSVIASHHLHQLLMHHLDELLVRADPTNHFGADGLLPHIGNKVFDHRQAHIRFKQRSTHVFKGRLDVRLADGVLASQPLDRIFKAG